MASIAANERSSICSATQCSTRYPTDARLSLQSSIPRHRISSH
ncbi:unnamed protein product [Haemonchus placei]|uniref:Uncharacterized protein n=1 Tax=Haemonchus placei TaxID=6290 RepID=A0A3P7YNX4_HAEPC|nr:unnamed protein product [Haemonchus placei]